MYASKEIRRILEGDKKPAADTLSHAIQLLRRSEDAKEDLSIRVDELHTAMAQLSDACRSDMQKLGLPRGV
jgi:DNA repair ATPase RecN